MQRVWLAGTKMALKTLICCVHNCSADQILIQRASEGVTSPEAQRSCKETQLRGRAAPCRAGARRRGASSTRQTDNWEHDARASWPKRRGRRRD